MVSEHDDSDEEFYFVRRRHRRPAVKFDGEHIDSVLTLNMDLVPLSLEDRRELH